MLEVNMKQGRRKLSFLMAFVMVLSIATITVSEKNTKVVQAASISGYNTLERSVSEGKISYQKVGDTYFGFNDNKIYAKKAGEKATKIASTSNYITTAFTNGSKVYYQIGKTVYSVGKDGKNKKTVRTWKNYNYTLSGVYGSNLYYSYRYGEYDFDQHTYCYNTKTKKAARVFKNLAISQQQGIYMTVVGLSNDVSPVELKCYNLKTKKLTSLCKEQLGASFVGNRIYYAKFISYNVDTNSSKFRIQYYDLKAGKTVKVKTIDGLQYVNEFTSKGCYYLDKDCNTKFYNYKTGKTTKA